MSNIQQSVNSLLTTGAALKTLNQDNEIRKSKQEKLDLEKELLKQQIENAKNAKINEAYVDVLKNPKKVQEPKDFKTLRPEKALYKSDKSIRHEKDLYKSDKSIRPEKDLYDNPYANTYNSNPEFAKSMKSAMDLYANSYNSLDSFMKEYNNRKSNGGNK